MTVRTSPFRPYLEHRAHCWDSLLVSPTRGCAGTQLQCSACSPVATWPRCRQVQVLLALDPRWRFERGLAPLPLQRRSVWATSPRRTRAKGEEEISRLVEVCQGYEDWAKFSALLHIRAALMQLAADTVCRSESAYISQLQSDWSATF